MARAATSPELAKFRHDGQKSELMLYVYNPIATLTAVITATPSDMDQVTGLSIGTLSADPALIHDGMTVWIGSSAGSSDIGILRARSCTSSKLSIGSTSGVQFASGQYVTVLPEWLIWSRKLAFTAGAWNLEGELGYSNQNAVPDPIPVLGPTIAVLRKVTSVVTLQMEANNSWCPGETITAYAWTTTGPAAVIIDNAAIHNPTFTFSTMGAYIIHCIVTASNGHQTEGYRYVYVYDDAHPPITQFKLDSCAGSTSDGGWSFSVTLYAEADTSAVRNQALAVLFARDWYGTASTDEGSIGPIPGYENVIAWGWIDDDETDENPEQGTVKITAYGPAHWMQQTGSWPFSIMDTTTTPVDWMHIQDLTIDKALWNFMYWHSTASRIIDIYPSGDTRRVFDCSANIGNLWDQLKQFAEPKIGAVAACDRYGRLFVEIDQQLISQTDRASLPVVMDVAKADWTDTITIQRKQPSVGLLETAAFVHTSGTWGAALSRSPGNAMTRLGSYQSRYNLVAVDQAGLNALTGRIFAKMNNPYPSVPIKLAANNRLIDIAPRQYLTLSIASVDTPRGITWNAQRIIPRQVSLTHDPTSGLLLTGIEAEAETDGPAGIYVAPPPSAPTTPPGQDPNPKPTPNPNPSPVDPPPTVDPSITDPCTDSANAGGTGPFALSFDKTTINAGQTAYAMFPCGIRYAGATNRSSFWLDQCLGSGDAWTNYSLFAVDVSKNNILNADAGTRQFTPASGVQAAGFGISVAAGGASPTGTIAGNNASGVQITGLAVGAIYVLAGSGGPWTYNVLGFQSYQFQVSLDGSNWSNIGLGWCWPFGMALNAPAWATASILDTYHAQIKFTATQTAIWIRCADTDYGDNGGSMDYVLYATAQPNSAAVGGFYCYVWDPNYEAVNLTQTSVITAYSAEYNNSFGAGRSPSRCRIGFDWDKAYNLSSYVVTVSANVADNKYSWSTTNAYGHGWVQISVLQTIDNQTWKFGSYSQYGNDGMEINFWYPGGAGNFTPFSCSMSILSINDIPISTAPVQPRYLILQNPMIRNVC